MGNNSMRLTVETMSAWRSGLKHIKERKAKLDERNRRSQKRNNIEKRNSRSSFNNNKY
tara:strand:- start:324 stop:497 length:174 start_codon:yes stop_codon:yes gene_type:complete